MKEQIEQIMRYLDDVMQGHEEPDADRIAQDVVRLERLMAQSADNEKMFNALSTAYEHMKRIETIVRDERLTQANRPPEL